MAGPSLFVVCAENGNLPVPVPLVLVLMKLNLLGHGRKHVEIVPNLCFFPRGGQVNLDIEIVIKVKEAWIVQQALGNFDIAIFVKTGQEDIGHKSFSCMLEIAILHNRSPGTVQSHYRLLQEMTIEVNDVFHQGHDDPVGDFSNFASTVILRPFYNFCFLNSSLQFYHDISPVIFVHAEQKSWFLKP